MKKQEKDALNRALKEQDFMNAEKAIKGGESKSLKNPELVKELVEKYKGKTIQAPIEVIVTSAIFLNSKEIMGVIEALKYTAIIKATEELEHKIDNGEAAVEDFNAYLAFYLNMLKNKEA